MLSAEDHSLSLGSMTPSFIISSNSRFAVTSLSGANRRGRANTGCPLVTILCVIPCLTVSPFVVGVSVPGTGRGVLCTRSEQCLLCSMTVV